MFTLFYFAPSFLLLKGIRRYAYVRPIVVEQRPTHRKRKTTARTPPLRRSRKRNKPDDAVVITEDNRIPFRSPLLRPQP